VATTKRMSLRLNQSMRQLEKQVTVAIPTTGRLMQADLPITVPRLRKKEARIILKTRIIRPLT